MSNSSDLPSITLEGNAMSVDSVRQKSTTRSHAPRLAGRRYSRQMLNRFPSRGNDVSHLCLKMSQALDDFNSRLGQAEQPIASEKQRYLDMESTQESNLEGDVRNIPVSRKRPACQSFTLEADNPLYHAGPGPGHRRLVRQHAFRLREGQDVMALMDYDSESSCLTESSN